MASSVVRYVTPSECRSLAPQCKVATVLNLMGLFDPPRPGRTCRQSSMPRPAPCLQSTGEAASSPTTQAIPAPGPSRQEPAPRAARIGPGNRVSATDAGAAARGGDPSVQPKRTRSLQAPAAAADGQNATAGMVPPPQRDTAKRDRLRGCERPRPILGHRAAPETGRRQQATLSAGHWTTATAMTLTGRYGAHSVGISLHTRRNPDMPGRAHVLGEPGQFSMRLPGRIARVRPRRSSRRYAAGGRAQVSWPAWTRPS